MEEILEAKTKHVTKMPDNDIIVGDPDKSAPEVNLITIYADSITPISTFSGDTNPVASFDIIFTVNCVCPKSGNTSTYKVTKRIGLDKVKMAETAKLSTPVKVIEKRIGMLPSRYKTLAGL